MGWGWRGEKGGGGGGLSLSDRDERERETLEVAGRWGGVGGGEERRENWGEGIDRSIRLSKSPDDKAEKSV